jgi:transposase-like protein
MSKIPQGEWDAIAARYAQGETISKIAQSYGCTPPAIHYILKRSKQRAAPKMQQPLRVGPQTLSVPAHRPGQSPATQERGRPLGFSGDVAGSARLRPDEGRPAAAQSVELRPSREREVSSEGLITNGRPQPAATQQPIGAARGSGDRPSAFTAGLDRELHGRVEAAIAAFRSSFDAALAEGSPDVRHRLRQAASDLMRVAARTTIVLDRLNATAEHTGGGREAPSSGRPRF